jgi:hypothetical protein
LESKKRVKKGKKGSMGRPMYGRWAKWAKMEGVTKVWVLEEPGAGNLTEANRFFKIILIGL